MDTIYFVQLTDAFSHEFILVRLDLIQKVEEFHSDEYDNIRKITYTNKEYDYVADSMDSLVCILNGGEIM